MVFGMIPGFYDYETFIESFLRFEPGTNFGCGRRIDQLAILAFSSDTAYFCWRFELECKAQNFSSEILDGKKFDRDEITTIMKDGKKCSS